MESPEVLMNGGISNWGVTVSCENGLEQVNGLNELQRVGGYDMGKGTLADEVLEDFDEYWEDINDRLMISRMVSDSIIKGMVTAVEQEAAEKIAAKELELANLLKFLHTGEVGACRHDVLVGHGCFEGENCGRFCSFSDACTKHDKMRVDLYSLRNAAREQFLDAKKKVACAKGCNSIKKVGSGCELVGLSGILQEQQSECWLHVSEMLEQLMATVDTAFTKVDDMLLSSKISLSGWQEERDLSKEIEDMVIQSVLRSLQEEFEEKFWEQSAQFIGKRDIDWIDKFNDLSSLRSQLDIIIKSLSASEPGLVSHGSHDLDRLPHKGFSNLVSPPTSFGEENGTPESPNTRVPESYDFQQLKHMTGEQLVQHFNSIITKIRRDHEIVLHEKTEKYYSLRREYLKVKDSFTPHRKDEEFDVIRKKVPEVIMKLEDFLSENERFPALTTHAESMKNMKERFQSLVSENRQLRDCLSDKINQIKQLEAQIFGSVGKSFDPSLVEQNMLKTVSDLKSAVEDSCIVASLNEEVYTCVLRDLIGQMKWKSGDSNMELLMMQQINDIIIREAATSVCGTRSCEIEDSDIKTLTEQGLNEIIFSECIKDFMETLNRLHEELHCEREMRTCFEKEVFNKENELRLEVEEKDRLRQEVLHLGTTVKQKEKVVMDLSTTLSKEKEQFELVSRELTNANDHAIQQQRLVAENNKEIEALQTQLTEAIELHKLELDKLNEKLDRTNEVLVEANKDRDSAFALAQETRNKLSCSEAREGALQKDLEVIMDNICRFSGMFDDFECKIYGSIIKNDLRLQDTTNHLKVLTKMANELRRTGLKYKQRLDQRFADLQMAEAEVDLLGDEVDVLLRLLEKIYIALDHYSPILKHYPGIIEILQLVRRELTGESTKLPRSSPWQDKENRRFIGQK